ncbi:unnamed protein product [Schistosoma haematobium]|nr:unnamed protein product [Schistosoma haematobium]CAH8526989.1 unnamed protein product [Schistosoma haematobium]
MTSDIAKRQRTVPSAKAFEFIWKRPVPEVLQTGEHFDRYDEETGILEPNCFVRVDKDGFFIYWQSENNDSQQLELSQISDVRSGTKPKDEKLTAQIQEKSGKSWDRIVTICSGLDLVNINYTHMVAKDAETASFWIQSLRSLTHNTKAANVCPMTQLRKHWLRLTLTLNARNRIPVRVIMKTFASGRNERIVYQSLKDLNLPHGKNDDIDPNEFPFEKFYELYHKICPRTDIEDLFKSLSKGKSHIHADKMIEFLNETQRDPRLNEILYPFANKQTIKYIQENYETQEEFKNTDEVSIECFYRYLMSDDNACVFLDKLDIYQDMDQPLSHYYINSSHNTYLIGRQFGGKSSVEMYRQVLLAGCRCIELDCWDGRGEDQEPIITHGKAMCTDILFKDVIYAIRDTAFVASDCPVIMSFENHCSKHQQYKLAKYCEEILGDMLLTKPLDNYSLEPGVALPPPEKLKRKILIKNKRLKPEAEKQQLDLFLKGQTDAIQEENEVTEDPDLTIDRDDGDGCSANKANNGEFTATTTTTGSGGGGETVISLNATPTPQLVSCTSSAELKRLQLKKEEGNLTAEEEQIMMAHYHYTGATSSIHPLLSSFVNYAQPVKFQGFDVAEASNISHHMSSFNESIALGLIKKHCIAFVNYNKRQMSRIYPRGNRVDSSNYMPQIFWNAGCQMVALNFQTPDLAMQLNQGKFEYNGNCGYLLKPEFMRRPERQFDPFSESPMDGVIAATCEVKIISGQFLSDRKVGTYVEVDMYGLPTDTIRKEFRTRVVPNNGLNPVYGDDAVFVFRKVVLPDLAVLRFAVYEDTGKLIGQRVLPLDGLQAGYRHISLRTEGNFPLSLPTLFCQVSLTTYVPEGLNDLVDALSDPRAFLSKEEQRMKQLASMGIDSSEIADVPSTGGGGNARRVGGGGGGAGGGSSSGLGGTSGQLSGSIMSNISGSGETSNVSSNSTKKDEKKDDPKFDPISISLLQTDKMYQKLIKKQAKELEILQKRQEKDAVTMLRNHTIITDKLNTSHAKERSSTKRSVNKENGQNAALQDTHHNQMCELVRQHTDQWSSLKSTQMKEVYDLVLSFFDSRKDLLIKIMKEVQEEQKRELRIIQDREVKEMKAQQTKASIESNRSVMNDRKLRNKAERDRRIRELNDYNTKRFIDQRKLQAQRHDKQTQELNKRHTLDEQEIINGIKKEREEFIRKYEEDLLALKRATVI